MVIKATAAPKRGASSVKARNNMYSTVNIIRCTYHMRCLYVCHLHINMELILYFIY
jgi:succinate dehydrogenase/fumarate reductase-like Fe-S protein